MEFLTLLLSGIFFMIYPVINPDYDAYSVIYSTADLGGDWEVFYIYLNHFFREAGFTYDQFRLFILLFSFNCFNSFLIVSSGFLLIIVRSYNIELIFSLNVLTLHFSILHISM